MKFRLLLIVCPLFAVTLMAQPVQDDAPVSNPPNALLGPAALPFPAPNTDGRTFYRWSLAAVTAANTADAISSWHLRESNPLLAGSNSYFDSRSVAIKSLFLSASFFIEHWALRHNPTLYRTFAWINVAIAGGLSAVVVHNSSLR